MSEFPSFLRLNNISLYVQIGLPWWLSGKESACNSGATGDVGSIPGSGRPLGGGHGNPLQYSCLENPMDRGAWQATVHRVAKSWTWLKQLSTHAHTHVQVIFCLFVCQWTLGCFHVLTIVNNAAINKSVQIFIQILKRLLKRCNKYVQESKRQDGEFHQRFEIYFF